MRTRTRLSTSHIHFIISKTVSAVPADATEVPTSRHKTSSTNGLAATGPQSESNFQKKFPETNFFHIRYDQKNTLNPTVKSVFKSVHNHRRYLHFCDCHVCSIKYAATQRLQLRAWPILCTGLRPVQLFLVIYDFSVICYCWICYFVAYVCHLLTWLLIWFKSLVRICLLFFICNYVSLKLCLCCWNWFLRLLYEL